MERLIKELDKNLVLTEVENIDINCSVLLHIEYDKSYISCCPECGQPTARKNGAHKRTVKDLPLMGRKVIFVIKVRELFCDNSCCPRKTFSERFHFLGETGFRTQRLDDYAVRSFLESSAIATERLFSDKVADISNDTILRLVKKNADKQ